MGSYLLQSRAANPLYDYDCTGYFGFQCSQPNSVWRHRFRGTWETNFNMNFSLAWRFLGGTDNDDSSPDEDLANPDQMELWTGSYMDTLPDYNWFDLSATYNFGNGLRFTIGCNNIFDKEPPLAPEFSDDPNHFFHGSYEPLGRYLFTSLQFNF
jgi:outer membrane receptor protein involved in Fe transport